MNRLKLDNLGGLRFNQDILAFLQAAGNDAFGALAALSGPLVIVTGCAVTGSTNANGWVAINGELLPFEGGTITGTVDIIETVTQKTFEDDVDRDMLIERKVANVVSGAYTWANFKRLPTLNQMAPPGILQPYAGSAAPSGWLLCDGSAVSRTTYADLFAVISTTYGVGNGSTTFNLPDLKGKVVVGLNAGEAEFTPIGTTGGAKEITLTTPQIPSHTHSMSFDRTKRGEGSDPNDAAAAPDGTHFGTDFSKTTAGTGGGEAHSNLQPYISLPYIIKY